MKDVYVVRWVEKRITEDDEFEVESGNFEFCYENEKDAINAMLTEFRTVRNEWKEYCCRDAETDLTETITTDYCMLNNDWDNSTYEWFIDKIGIAA